MTQVPLSETEEMYAKAGKQVCPVCRGNGARWQDLNERTSGWRECHRCRGQGHIGPARQIRAEGQEADDAK